MKLVPMHNCPFGFAAEVGNISAESPERVRLVGSGFLNVGTTQKADDAGASVLGSIRAYDNAALRELAGGKGGSKSRSLKDG